MRQVPVRILPPDDSVSVSRSQLWLALGFPFFTVTALGIDSVSFLNTYFDGRQVTNALAIFYFLVMLWVSDVRLRRLMLVMVWLSYVGELIFCKLLGMYEYRTAAIPLYVPFGHAIVYASGYIFAHARFAKAGCKKLLRFFVAAFFLLFLCVGILLNDIFSVLSGVLFFVLLRRKRWQNIFLHRPVCDIYRVGRYVFQMLGMDSENLWPYPGCQPTHGCRFFLCRGRCTACKNYRHLGKENEAA